MSSIGLVREVSHFFVPPRQLLPSSSGMDALRALLGRAPPPPTGLAAVTAAVASFLAPASRHLTAAALAGSSLGFLRPIWFISVGARGEDD